MTLNWHGDDPILMGIVNVTPDSFSDGGKYLKADDAIAHGLKLHQEGAAILDIGGESTRPGSDPVPPEQELQRVIPVVKALRDCGSLISIDTRNASVMKAAIDAGAGLVNDVSALEHDPASMDIIVQSEVMVSLMHMKGDPRTMQDNPHYDNVLQEVYDYLEERIAACIEAGIDQNRIIIDPGIGFGKTLEHNLTLLKKIDFFRSLGVKILLGASRKRFIETLSAKAAAHDRVGGSIAACLSAYQKGIRLFRVHDVKETAQALAVFRAL